MAPRTVRRPATSSTGGPRLWVLSVRFDVVRLVGSVGGDSAGTSLQVKRRGSDTTTDVSRRGWASGAWWVHG
jgi:sensor domain CHASE-containing protein